MDASARKLAVQFGAGNIGRGFLASLFSESGYRTVFIDTNGELVEALNEFGGYSVFAVSDDGATTEPVTHVSGLSAFDSEHVAGAVMEADIAATAVGGGALASVAGLLAAGIARRAVHRPDAPLDVLVCENLHDAPAHLRGEVGKHLDSTAANWAETHVGFVETVIGRMVPAGTRPAGESNPLDIRVEPYNTLPVDADGFRGAPPPIARMECCRPFAPWRHKKLYIHNAGHSAAAYLGHLRGYPDLPQAMADTPVRLFVSAAMIESADAIQAAHGESAAHLKAYVEDLLQRFANRALGDTVARVARDPWRKLQRDDRLLGAAQFALDYGIEPHALGLAAAAAIRYDAAGDPSAHEVQSAFREGGIEGVLRNVAGLESQSPLIPYVMRGHERLREEGWVS